MNKDIISEVQDLRHLSWTKTRRSSGTAGSFLKSFDIVAGRRVYYKLSNYDAYCGIIGHECINELIADRLLTILGIEHLHYQLIHARITAGGKEYTTWLCASEDFKKPGESKVALDVFYQLEKIYDEAPMEFCIRQGWADYIYRMLLVDFLILNRDRHGANMEVLKDRKARSIRLAPLFDHGLSLLFSCRDETEMTSFDVMADKPVQCFVGSNSAQTNLHLIPRQYDLNIHPLVEADEKLLLAGISAAMPEIFCRTVWNMIWNRWRYYEDLRDKG